MNADGSNTKRITNDASSEYDPFWSPDGEIVFVSNRDGTHQIYVTDHDGENLKRLAYTDTWDLDPSFSPDGEKIIFYSYKMWGYQVYVMDSEGGNQTRITKSPISHTFPVWSPDGKKIAFEVDRFGDGIADIFVMNADGSNVVNLTDNPDKDMNPAWSPGGEKIAFFSNMDGGLLNDDVMFVPVNKEPSNVRLASAFIVLASAAVKILLFDPFDMKSETCTSNCPDKFERPLPAKPEASLNEIPDPVMSPPIEKSPDPDIFPLL